MTMFFGRLYAPEPPTEPISNAVGETSPTFATAMAATFGQDLMPAAVKMVSQI